jgi:hypothetical protein
VCCARTLVHRVLEYHSQPTQPIRCHTHLCTRYGEEENSWVHEDDMNPKIVAEYKEENGLELTDYDKE